MLPTRWVFVAVAVWVIGYTLSLAGPTSAQTAGTTVKKVESSNPFSGDPKAIASGRELYFTWCVQCHGKKADGVSPRWGKYAKDLRKFWQGYNKFVLITIQGVKGKQMPPWGEVLSGNQISYIGAYLETLAMEGASWK